MAGMFYSLQEVIEKMQITKERIDELVRDGRLREFRDGANLLFKVDEVEALMADTSFMGAQQPSPPEPQTDQEPLLIDLEPAESEPEPADLSEADTGDIGGEETIVPEVSEAAAAPPVEAAANISGQEAEVTEEISLEPEFAESSQKGLSDADTILADEGTDLLSETDAAQETGADLLGATKAESDQASLEQIEEDINLDTFGSGSGLLDLSLQADDTSLGGVLDEIYTSEGDEEKGSGEVSAAGVTAEAEEILSDEGLPAAEPAAVAMVPMYAEAQPDAISNAFGLVLFVPLLVVIYTAIVVLAGFNNIMPFVVEQTKGMIWYIAIGLAVLALVIIGVPFMLGGKAGAKPKVKAKAKTKKAKNKKAAQLKANSKSD